MINKLIYNYFDDFLKQAENALTFERKFDLLGLTRILKRKHIETEDLNETYVNAFENSINKFIKQPLYTDLDLNVEEDLIFLRDTPLFKDNLENTIKKIRKWKKT